jgi:hypothetical protein
MILLRGPLGLPTERDPHFDTDKTLFAATASCLATSALNQRAWRPAPEIPEPQEPA